MPNAWELAIVARLRGPKHRKAHAQHVRRKRLFAGEKLESRFTLSQETSDLTSLQSWASIVSPAESRTALESMEQACSDTELSYGGDPYGGDPYGGDPYGGDPYGGDAGPNQAPVITDFDIDFLGDGDWRLFGTVEDDEAAEGREVRFAGDLSTECTVLTGGTFSTVIHLTDVYSGMVSAGFTDRHGLNADTVWRPFG